MNRKSNTFASLLGALLVAGSAGLALAQSANGGGAGAGGGAEGGAGSSYTRTFGAVAYVPDNTTYPPRQPQVLGPGCVSATEGIRGPKQQGPCSPH